MSPQRTSARNLARALVAIGLIAGSAEARLHAAEAPTGFVPKAVHQFVFNARVQEYGNPFVHTTFYWALHRLPQNGLGGTFMWPADSNCHSKVGQGSTLDKQSLYLIGTCKRTGTFYFSGRLDFATGKGHGTLSSPGEYSGTWTSSPGG